ncbi:hypothetical protein Mgra_00007954 [Meloidogyne graminicola]|uniref:Uncharacterized protein n=1 Tax=Meloidogyne graminicola TaxID=189291 RepID=A0A8S9ZH40_9BILA|nr:hypothetical protein Mgra_00007954 [Meloidogyne graminicola]
METIIIKEIKQQIKKYCYNAINILTCSKVFYIFIGGIFKERKSYFSIYLQTMANVEKRIEELERELSDVKKENAAKIEQLENELSEVKRENAAIKKELSDVKQFIYITNNLLLPNGACCEKNCILLNDACQNNCGFVSIGGGGQTALYNEGEVNREIQLVCQNAFLPMFPYKQSMYYFEAKIKHLQDEDFVFKLEIGLEADNCCVKLYIESNKHDYQLGENFDNEGNEYEMEDSSESQKDNGYGIDFLRDGANAATVNVDEIPLNVDDTIGCGIVLPGIQNGQNNSYIFFTFNKVKIGSFINSFYFSLPNAFH